MDDVTFEKWFKISVRRHQERVGRVGPAHKGQGEHAGRIHKTKQVYERKLIE